MVERHVNQIPVQSFTCYWEKRWALTEAAPCQVDQQKQVAWCHDVTGLIGWGGFCGETRWGGNDKPQQWQQLWFTCFCKKKKKNKNYSSFIVSSVWNQCFSKALHKVAFRTSFHVIIVAVMDEWMNARVWLKSEIKWPFLIQRWINGCMSGKNAEIQHYSTPHSENTNNMNQLECTVEKTILLKNVSDNNYWWTKKK